jgi:hypothetical protein
VEWHSSQEESSGYQREKNQSDLLRQTYATFQGSVEGGDPDTSTVWPLEMTQVLPLVREWTGRASAQCRTLVAAACTQLTSTSSLCKCCLQSRSQANKVRELHVARFSQMHPLFVGEVATTREGTKQQIGPQGDHGSTVGSLAGAYSIDMLHAHIRLCIE